MNVAEIKIWNQVVGAVVWDNTRNLATFEFASGFKQLNWDLAPIKMPIKQPIQSYNFPELAHQPPMLNTFKGLPGLLADSLPDRYGSQLIAKEY